MSDCSRKKKQTLILINKQTKKKKNGNSKLEFGRRKKIHSMCTNYMGDEIANKKLKIPSLESQMKSTTVKKEKGPLTMVIGKKSEGTTNSRRGFDRRFAREETTNKKGYSLYNQF